MHIILHTIYYILHVLYCLYTPYTIGGLMRVGFGEAGANVIAKNLAESSGGRLNLMGLYIMSCYSVCLYT